MDSVVRVFESEGEEMKVYIICFADAGISYPKVFLDREKAEGRLKSIQKEIDADADRYQCKSYSHLYSLDELEVEE